MENLIKIDNETLELTETKKRLISKQMLLDEKQFFEKRLAEINAFLAKFK